MKEDNLNNDDRQYLQMLHDIITRMATNSANCKTWLITLITGFFAVSIGVDTLRGWIWILLFPIILFWYLDQLYLSLERAFRNRERNFLNEIFIDEISKEKYHKLLYDFKPLFISTEDKASGLVSTDGMWKTKSVVPFYGILSIIVIAVTVIANWSAIVLWICNLICK